MADPAPSSFDRLPAWLNVGALYTHIADRFLVKRWGTVVPGKIYRSGQISSTAIERTLRKHGIRVIINLRGRRGWDQAQIREAEVARLLDIHVIYLPLKGDGTGELSHYHWAIRHMVEAEREGKPLLVHCAAGTQRTGGVVAAYRLLVQKAPLEPVYEELKRHNWKPDKDAVLLNYLNDNMAALAQMLMRAGIIDRVPDRLPRLEVRDARRRHRSPWGRLFSFQQDG